MAYDERNARRNGFEKPLDLLQIAAWLIIIILVASFYGLFIPPLEAAVVVAILLKTSEIILSFFYGVFAAGSVTFASVACWINPVDCFGQEPVRDDSNSIENVIRCRMSYCFLCQRHVKLGSKHCRYCKKCVDVFDHHCKWLNNCIGKKNYIYFIMLLIFVVLLMSLHCGVGIRLIFEFHASTPDFDDTVRRTYKGLGVNGYVVLLYLLTVVAAILLLVVLKLLVFHFGLMRNHITTYDFIIRAQQRIQERQLHAERKEHELVDRQGKDAA